MSSPRIATLNNQKAVLKVGTDDFFVTNVTTTTTASASGNTISPSITLQPFFSGISLDVMPQIDDEDNVMLHIRPSISNVTENNKQINLGSAGVFNLPLASSRTNETDSIVRVREGNIVAIGGLMEQTQTNDNAKVPGAGDLPVVGGLFSQGKKALQKRELVVLLKATIIRSDKDWSQDLRDTTERLSGLKQEPLGPHW
jgi:MSHA biogenesis protein MshL